MQHSFDVGQADLKRSMDVLLTVGSVQNGGILLRNDALAVKVQGINLHLLFYPVIPAWIALSSIILHSNHWIIVFGGDGIINDVRHWRG